MASDPTPGQTGGTTLEGAVRVAEGTWVPRVLAVEASRTWPTPRVSDDSAGRVLTENASGTLVRVSASGEYGPNLADLARRQWPTPSANEDAAGTPNGQMQPMLGNHPDVREQKTGALNPDWTECLMGWPVGWTALDPLPELVWPALNGLQVAPPGPYQHDWEPPRVATGVKDRAKRLRCIGNGQHPFTAVMAWTLRRPGGSD